jgi:site-specific DNA-methyltransferase (adenine-specific)
MKATRSLDLRLGDALELLGELPDESVDLVLTDPPWPSLEAHRAVGTTTRLQGQWFPVLSDAGLLELLGQLHRVLRPDRHAYIVADWPSLRSAADAAEDAGFRLWTPLIWDKVRIGMGYHWRSSWEAVLFLEKGKRRLRDLSLGNVLHVPRPSRPIWPCEKPVDLWIPLVRNSLPDPEELPKQLRLLEEGVDYPAGCKPYGTPCHPSMAEGRPVVLDPFVGSGSSLVAALEAGASVVGFDVQEAALELTRRRLLEAVALFHELEAQEGGGP